MFIDSGWEEEEVSLANLADFPLFLRFNDVLLRYEIGHFSQSLLKKSLLFEECLNAIKSALKDSNKIRFDATIDKFDPSHFSDHSSVVIYLRDRLLPICDSSRCYEFNITFAFDGNSASEVISSILQIPQVRSCLNVSVGVFCDHYHLIILPVEDVSNWLAPKTDDCIEIYRRKQQDRILKICCWIISDIQEMWNHLREVNLVHNFAHC